MAQRRGYGLKNRHHRDYGKRKAEFDPEAKRYHVYRIYDGAGRLLYIGRSHDPLARLKAHLAGTEWAEGAAEIQGHGPYAWAEAVRRERQEILRLRPPHNIDGVTKKTGRNFSELAAS